MRRRGVPIPTASTATGSTAPAGPVRLEVTGLSKSFGPVQAVSELSFTVEPGSVTGFLGPTVPGRPRPCAWSSGSCTRRGDGDLRRHALHRAARSLRTVGAVLETAFHPARSGRNHLRVYCRAAGLPLSRADEVLLQVGLAEAGNRRAGGYSLGMRQRLGAGHRPDRRPRRPGAGRAGQRPGPRGHPVAARLPAPPGPRAGPHDPGVQSPAVGGGADGRPRGHRRRRPAGARGLDGAAASGGRRRRHGPRPRPRGAGSPRCSRAGGATWRTPTAASPSPAPPRRGRPPRLHRRGRAARAPVADQRARGDLLPAHHRPGAVRRSARRHPRPPGATR